MRNLTTQRIDKEYVRFVISNDADLLVGLISAYALQPEEQ